MPQPNYELLKVYKVLVIMNFWMLLGADPSPAQFNIMIHGEEDEVLDGTQLAADWTFSGLQKFGQAFLDRLRGRKLPNRLLEKVSFIYYYFLIHILCLETNCRIGSSMERIITHDWYLPDWLLFEAAHNDFSSSLLGGYQSYNHHQLSINREAY